MQMPQRVLFGESCFCNVFGLIIVRRQRVARSLKIVLLALANATFAYNVSRPQAAPTVGQNLHSACLHRLWGYVILMAGAAAFAAAVAAAANDQWRLNWLPQLCPLKMRANCTSTSTKTTPASR